MVASAKVSTQSAYRLLHEGTLALARVEANGIRLDMRHLKRARADTQESIADLTRKLKGDGRVWGAWRKRFGDRTNLDSNEQLGTVVFDILGFDRRPHHDNNDEEAFADINLQFVEDYFARKKLDKLEGTYLKGLEFHQVNGWLHPSYNLHIARTYRSSSSDPNFQNLPIRDPRQAEVLRRCFVAMNKNHHLVEIDYGGIEVCIAACYHKDPAMISYIQDPTKDMHRDMAAACFKLDEDQVTKDARYCGKNKFVFPQFYGDFYPRCANALWEEGIKRLHLETVDGVPMMQHLKSVGLGRKGACDPDQDPVKGTFEYHIKEVESWFWNELFRDYGKWKKTWWKQFQGRGWYEMLSGFRVSGVYSRNDVINHPVQGSAFHCLLWSLIEIQKELIRGKWRSRLVGQIHDSILADVHKDELDEFIAMCREIMIDRLTQAWRWIIVPLTVEAEVCPLEGSWWDKKEYEE